MRVSLSIQEFSSLMQENTRLIAYKLSKPYGFTYFISLNGVDLELITQNEVDNSLFNNRIKNLSTDDTTTGNGDFAIGVDYNKIQFEYPDSTTELIKYYYDLSLVRTVTVQYETSEKKNILSVEVS